MHRNSFQRLASSFRVLPGRKPYTGDEGAFRANFSEFSGKFVFCLGQQMIGSLGDLASMPGMPSEPTLRKLITDNADFPIVSRGTNGRAYEIDLVEAHAFIRALQAKEEEEARAHSNAVRQLGLELLGDDALAATDQQSGLTPTERLQLMQEEMLRIKLAQQKGDLVRADEIEAAIAEALVWFRESGRMFSGKVAKRLTFSREQLAAIDLVMDQMLTGLADRMEKISDDVALSRADAAAAIPPRA